MKPELMDEIEKIPMLPETIRKLEEVYNNPSSTAHDIVKAIQSDPLLIARILKLANSPLYGLSRTVTDVAHAVSLLGRDMIHTFAVSSAAEDILGLDLSPYGVSKEEYLQRAQLQHALAVALALKISRQSLPQVSLGSYLLGLGRVVISRYLIENNLAHTFAEALNGGANTKALEVEYCGSKAEDVLATIFNRWEFQGDLVYVIRYANEPEDASDEVLKTGSKILKIAKESVGLHGKITDDSIHVGRYLSQEYGFKVEVFNEVIATLQERMQAEG